MFVVDDILLSPFKGFMWILREVQKAAGAELENEADSLTQRLSTLYMQLETGQITPAEFDDAERAILDRLEQLEGQTASDEEEDDDEDDEDESDDSEDDGDEDDTDGASDATSIDATLASSSAPGTPSAPSTSLSSSARRSAPREE